MTAVVTGASGHIGGVLVRQLLAQGRPVRALVHSDRRALEDLGDGGGLLELVAGDVLDRQAMQRLCEGASVVFHLAAVISIVGDPDGRVRAVNVEGVRNVAEAALAVGVERMVHVSSIHAFDINSGASFIDENSGRVGADAPAYDRSKAAGEVALREVIEQGLDAVVVNPGGVLGPFDFVPSRMGTFFSQLALRRLPALVPGGFSWVDVRDVCAAILSAEGQGRRGESYLLCGSWHSMQELADMAQQVTGVRAPSLSVPMWLAQLGAPFMTLWANLRSEEPLYTSEALHAVVACRDVRSAKASRELGFNPRPVQDTVSDVYRCFAHRGVLCLAELQGCGAPQL